MPAAYDTDLYGENHLLNSRARNRHTDPLMPRFSGRLALRPLCVCALVGSIATGVHAMEPTAPDDGAITLDQTVQAIKDEAIQFNRDALLAEEAFLYPTQTRVSVYVSNRLPNVLLSDINLTIDDGAPVTYRYGERDSRALVEKGALQRLLITNLDRGTHRLRVSFNGHYVEGDDEPEPLAGRFEAVFTKGLEASDVELQILRGSSRKEPAMKLKEWRAAEE